MTLISGNGTRYPTISSNSKTSRSRRQSVAVFSDTFFSRTNFHRAPRGRRTVCLSSFHFRISFAYDVMTRGATDRNVYFISFSLYISTSLLNFPRWNAARSRSIDLKTLFFSTSIHRSCLSSFKRAFLSWVTTSLTCIFDIRCCVDCDTIHLSALSAIQNQRRNFERRFAPELGLARIPNECDVTNYDIKYVRCS